MMPAHTFCGLCRLWNTKNPAHHLLGNARVVAMADLSLNLNSNKIQSPLVPPQPPDRNSHDERLRRSRPLYWPIFSRSAFG